MQLTSTCIEHICGLTNMLEPLLINYGPTMNFLVQIHKKRNTFNIGVLNFPNVLGQINLTISNRREYSTFGEEHIIP